VGQDSDDAARIEGLLDAAVEFAGDPTGLAGGREFLAPVAAVIGQVRVADILLVLAQFGQPCG